MHLATGLAFETVFTVVCQNWTFSKMTFNVWEKITINVYDHILLIVKSVVRYFEHLVVKDSISVEYLRKGVLRLEQTPCS